MIAIYITLVPQRWEQPGWNVCVCNMWWELQHKPHAGAEPFVSHPTSLSPEPQHLTPTHPEVLPQGNLLFQSEMATAKSPKPQLTCKAHKDGRKRKPERQKLSFIISVSKALPKAEIKLRAPLSKPKSLFLGLDKSHDNWLQIRVQPENQAATKLLGPSGRSNAMSNYADSKMGNQALNPEQSLTLPSQVA